MTDSQRNAAMTGAFVLSCLGMVAIYGWVCWAARRDIRQMKESLASSASDGGSAPPETLDG